MKKIGSIPTDSSIQIFDRKSNKPFTATISQLLALTGTGSSLVNITYSELYNKVVNGQLTPGQWYRLTDYKSVNFLNGIELAYNNPTPVDPNFNPQEIYEGDTEVLILQATSPYEIAEIGYSETFEGDIVQYEPYTNKIGLEFTIYNGNTLPDTSIVSGFDLQWDGTNVYFDMPAGYPALFGQPFYVYAEFDGGSYRLSQGNNPLVPNISNLQYIEYPLPPDVFSRVKVENNGQKIVLIDLTYNDFLDYDANTLTVATVYALGDAYGWITRRIDTYKNIDIPLDFRGRKYRRFECEIFGNIDGISYTATGATATDGIYTNLAYNLQTPGSTGIGATFLVKVSAGAVTEVRVWYPGTLYTTGTVLTILGSAIGGTDGVDDIDITIDSILSNIGYWGQGDVFNGAITTGNYQDFPVINYTAEKTNNIIWNNLGGFEPFSKGFANDNTIIIEAAFVTFEGVAVNNTMPYLYDVYFGNSVGGNSIESISSCNIGSSFYSNTIRSLLNNNIGTNFNFNIIFQLFSYNIIGNDFNYNTILGVNSNASTFFANNIIGNYFLNNIIGDNFTNNEIQFNFYFNKIYDNFRYNKIGNEFNNNLIDDGFGFGGFTFQGNLIGNNFSNNQIGEYFYNNRIIDNFSNNLVANYFQLNDVKASVLSTDFLLATHVYGSYNCDIFLRSDNTLRLSYIDGTDTINYTNIDA